MISTWPDVDRILQFTASSIRTQRLTAAAEDYFEHHFRGRPIVPAAMMVAWLEHSAGLLASHRSDGRLAAVLVEVRRVACQRSAFPGDALDIEVTLDGDGAELAHGRRVQATGTVMVQGETVLRAQISLEIVPYGQDAADWPALRERLGGNGLTGGDRE